MASSPPGGATSGQRVTTPKFGAEVSAPRPFEILRSDQNDIGGHLLGGHIGSVLKVLARSFTVQAVLFLLAVAAIAALMR